MGSDNPMTTPNNTVAGLAEKLVDVASRVEALLTAWGDSDERESRDKIADELRALAALASPAPSPPVGWRERLETLSKQYPLTSGVGAGIDRAIRELDAISQHPAAPSVSPAYDRELIAEMLGELFYDDGEKLHTRSRWTAEAIAEQARLLREADNAEAANVGTVSAPPSVAGDAGESFHNDCALIEAVLKGYPDSIAKSDALVAIRRLATAPAAPGAAVGVDALEHLTDVVHEGAVADALLHEKNGWDVDHRRNIREGLRLAAKRGLLPALTAALAGKDGAK
jgi:hypothetical protein